MLTENRSIYNMKMMKAGLIGVFGRGRNGWLMHQPENGWEIVAGADTKQSSRDKFAEKFPEAQLFEDYRELLKRSDIDAVMIATPDFCHEEQAIAALKAGKAVFLEKPLALTIEGCDRILRTAYETGTKLFLGHNMRYYPVILKMKEIIDSGIIGDVQCGWCRHFINYGGDAYFRDWHSEQRYSNGLLLQKGAHDIDVIHWLMGSYTSRVVGMGMLSVYDKCPRRPADSEGCAVWSIDQYPPLECHGFSPVIDVEDHNMIMMQLENGAQACYMQCHYTPDSERNYTFIGTKGRLENIGDAGKYEIHVWTRRGPRATPDIIYKLKEVEGTHGGSDPAMINAFLEFVRSGKVPNTTPIAAREAVAAGVLGHISMRNGCEPQAVPPLAEELIRYFENNQQK